MPRDERFGTCCKELRDALEGPFTSMLRVEENGVLYLAVGCVETPQGLGWFDSAVLYCPFCGRQLQDADAIRGRAGVG